MAVETKTQGKKPARSASKGRPPEKASPKKTKPPSDEGEPVLSGRMVIAVALALAMVVVTQQRNLGQAITKTAPRTTERAAWRVGETANVHLTVVTADYSQMACSDSRRAGKSHCEYKNEREPWPQDPESPVDDNKLHILQPYRTTDRNLLLLPGLWAQPEVAMRVHTEPPHGGNAKNLARFVVDCEIKFLEEWQNAVVRWKPSERWSNQGKAMVGEIVSCHILEDPTS